MSAILSATAVACGVALAGAVPAGAISSGTTITVTPSTDNNNDCSGSSPAVSCPSLRSAVSYANNHQQAGPFTINLMPGYYPLTIGPFADGGGHLDIQDGTDVTISGAGAQNTVVEASTLGDSALVVESGGTAKLQGVTFDGGSGAVPTAGVIAIDGDGVLTLSETTISGGIDHGIGSGLNAGGGGGIFNLGTLHIQSGTVISGNITTQDGNKQAGGGLYNNGTVDITGAQIIGNAAFDLGGGIYNDSSGHITITDTVIASNNAGDLGGGIYNLGTVDMTGGRLSGNEADAAQGGGVFNDVGGTLTLTSVVVSGNSADTGGGGVANSAFLEGSNSVTITGSTISGNAAVSNGGGIMNTGTMGVTGSTISGNSVQSLGGGVYNTGTLTMLNSTLARNSTDSADASALYNDGSGTANLSFVTMADNPGPGNSANLVTTVSATTNLVSSILAYAPGLQCAGVGTVHDIRGNMFTDNSCDVEAQFGDPQLLPLSENGTNVPQTMAIFSSAGNPSPAVGTTTGTCTDLATHTVSTDENGNPRPTAVGETNLCDAGAFQLGSPSAVTSAMTTGPVTLTVTDGEGHPVYGDPSDATCTVPGATGNCTSLRAAVAWADNHPAQPVVVQLWTGEYTLTPFNGKSPATTGSLAVEGGDGAPTLTLAGAGAAQTVIEGAGVLNDDVLSIRFPGSTTVTAQGLTIDGGSGGNAGNDASGAGNILNNGHLTLTDATVAGGAASPSSPGGGIQNSGSLTLGSGSAVDGNLATNSGGGLANSGSATLTNATISDNQAGTGGGGIYNSGTLSDTAGQFNSNSSPAGGRGGGVFNAASGLLSLSGTTLTGNSVLNGGQGGGIYNASPGVSVTGTPGAILDHVGITGSSANRHGGSEAPAEGGAIFNAGGFFIPAIELGSPATMTISHSSLIGNSADANGGGVFNSGSLSVDHSTLALNSVIVQWGGGIYDTSGGHLSLENSTLSGNSVVGNGSTFEGTALYKNGSATAFLAFDTLAGNPGAHNAATVYSGFSPSIDLFSNILAYGTGKQCEVDTPVFDGGGNVTADSTCTGLAGGEKGKDPMLLPLQFPGSGARPIMPLIPSSPAINTTTPPCTAGDLPVTDDENGQARPSTINGSTGCDAGAFQLQGQAPPPPPPVFNPTPPTVTAVSPAFGDPAGGNSVAITGTGFSTAPGGTTFNFGSNAATGVSCSSSTSCTVTAPAGALGPVDVRATVASLTSATNPGDVYTYVTTGGSSGGSTVCSTNQDARFVCQAYLDLQGRGVDPQGVITWSDGLIAGMLTRPQVVLGIDESIEYRTDLIQTWFRAYLNRGADPGAVTTFLTALESGLTEEQVQSFILGSPEYFTHSGGTNSAFLSALYQEVLNRPIDPAGSATWSAALAHLSRQQVALMILSSPEHETQLVANWYERFLHRPVDPGSLLAWVNAMSHGMSDEIVISGIVGSDEYFSHV